VVGQTDAQRVAAAARQLIGDVPFNGKWLSFPAEIKLGIE
jgi:hypothetical protein